MDISKELAKYRSKKLGNNMFHKTVDQEGQETLLSQTDSTLASIAVDDIEEVDASLNCLTITDILYYVLCFILWATVYAIFIKLQFGTVFLIVSCLIGIYLNTRTSPKKHGEVSAYSVFNKDCKSIDGTLKAEQFEREIRYGPSMMH